MTLFISLLSLKSPILTLPVIPAVAGRVTKCLPVPKVAYGFSSPNILVVFTVICLYRNQIVLRGELSYPVPLGDDPRGNIVRLDNAIGNFADRIADADAALDSLEQQKQAAEVEIAKPFAQEEELQTKSARLAELDALLNMEHQSSRTEPEAEEKPDARPSVLAALEEKADKVEPVRPFKSYLDKDGDAR